MIQDDRTLRFHQNTKFYCHQNYPILSISKCNHPRSSSLITSLLVMGFSYDLSSFDLERDRLFACPSKTLHSVTMDRVNFNPNPVVRTDDNNHSVAATIISGDAQSQFNQSVAASIGGNTFSQDPGFFARLELAIWVATHPGWLNHSVKPGLLFSGGASSCMTGDIAEGPGCVRLRSHRGDGGDGYLGSFYACQDYGTLIPTLILAMAFAQALALDFVTLAIISSCGPFVAFDADIVDKLSLRAASMMNCSSVHPIYGLPNAHNCDTETVSSINPYFGSAKQSLICSRKHCDSQSTLCPDGYATSRVALDTVASSNGTTLPCNGDTGCKPHQRNTPAFSTMPCRLTRTQWTPSRGSVNGLLCF